jgi:phytase-like protein
VPVDKVLFLDLLDPDHKINAEDAIKDVIAEKIESIAWGPDLPDGRHLLYVASDNDLFPGLPTQIYAFAIDGTAAGIKYEAQQLPGPLFPPGQVNKALNEK